MFRTEPSIVILAFLLINFFQLFLYREASNCFLTEYTIWINANILHLISVSGIFSRYWSSGALEQTVIFTSNMKWFITRTIMGAWFRQGIPLVLTATALFYLLETDSSKMGDIIAFCASLAYSTGIFSFTGASCGSLSISSHQITTIILAVPISIPGIIGALSILKWSPNNLSILLILLLGNTLTVTLLPLLTEIALRETLENL